MISAFLENVTTALSYISGSQWHNLFKAGSPDDTLTLGLVFVMLIIDTFLYLLIALYFEAILPGEYGIPKPWYFLFTRNFWCNETTIKGRLIRCL